ncbi:unnamed protein product [Dicrocoelium dendriticum]|nr:unnamed protein product [Dicrocoelium dendriticum]
MRMLLMGKCDALVLSKMSKSQLHMRGKSLCRLIVTVGGFTLFIWYLIYRHYVQTQVDRGSPIPEREIVCGSALSHRLQQCPPFNKNPYLHGEYNVSEETAPSWETIYRKYTAQGVSRTGSDNLYSVSCNSGSNTSQHPPPMWSPAECQPEQTVAIVIPYRNREMHLRSLVDHITPILRRQLTKYTMFVVEQVGETHFNRAALFNIAFIQSNKVADFDCFIFHDVDLLPLQDNLPYRCKKTRPVHLSVAVDKFDFKLPYLQLLGGVVAVSKEQFLNINGFSNCFFGWGGEDDDMFYRFRHKGYSIFRYPNELSRYHMHRHQQSELNNHRMETLEKSARRFDSDGYLQTKYTITSASTVHAGLIQWISVDLDERLMTSQCLR